MEQRLNTDTFKKRDNIKLLLSLMNIIISPPEDGDLQERPSLRKETLGLNTFISQDDSGYSDR